MDADGGVEPGVSLGQFDGGAAGGQVDARDEDAFDAGLECPFKDSFPVGVEGFQVQMAVCVGEHGVR